MPNLPVDWHADVLRFWFTELSEKDWWQSTHELDETIRKRFLITHGAVADAPLGALMATPEVTRAAVIVLDQFSRNMFRRSAQAFAHDPKALALAEAALANGYDQGLSTHERLFLYLPFEHAESAAAQLRSVALFTALGDAPALEAALAHKSIIDRFGRYPHRNAALGRTDTPDEAAYLAGEIKRYGQ